MYINNNERNTTKEKLRFLKQERNCIHLQGYNRQALEKGNKLTEKKLTNKNGLKGKHREINN